MTKIGGVLCCGGTQVNTAVHYRGELQKFLSDVSTKKLQQ